MAKTPSRKARALEAQAPSVRVAGLGVKPIISDKMGPQWDC